jgi:hypothetical protein
MLLLTVWTFPEALVELTVLSVVLDAVAGTRVPRLLAVLAPVASKPT